MEDRTYKILERKDYHVLYLQDLRKVEHGILYCHAVSILAFMSIRGTEKPCVSIGCGDSNVRMYISNMGDRQKKG